MFGRLLLFNATINNCFDRSVERLYGAVARAWNRVGGRGLDSRRGPL